MTTEDQGPIETDAQQTPQERFEKLAETSPVRRVSRPRPMFVIAVVIAVALVALVFSAYALWVPAADLFDGYTRRLWDQMF